MRETPPPLAQPNGGSQDSRGPEGSPRPGPNAKIPAPSGKFKKSSPLPAQTRTPYWLGTRGPQKPQDWGGGEAARSPSEIPGSGCRPCQALRWPGCSRPDLPPGPSAGPWAADSAPGPGAASGCRWDLGNRARGAEHCWWEGSGTPEPSRPRFLGTPRGSRDWPRSPRANPAGTRWEGAGELGVRPKGASRNLQWSCPKGRRAYAGRGQSW